MGIPFHLFLNKAPGSETLRSSSLKLKVIARNGANRGGYLESQQAIRLPARERRKISINQMLA